MDYRVEGDESKKVFASPGTRISAVNNDWSSKKFLASTAKESRLVLSLKMRDTHSELSFRQNSKIFSFYSANLIALSRQE